MNMDDDLEENSASSENSPERILTQLKDLKTSWEKYSKKHEGNRPIADILERNYFLTLKQNSDRENGGERKGAS